MSQSKIFNGEYIRNFVLHQEEKWWPVLWRSEIQPMRSVVMV